MKTIHVLISLSVTLLIGSCKENTSNGDLIVMDVTADYPEKTLVLQDFAEVEYIPMETTDEFLTQGIVMDVGEKYFVDKNRVNDGDIFLFERTGKANRKINRKGQGGEEYSHISRIILDEKREEIFVNDETTKKIYVYNMEGEFIRSFTHQPETQYAEVFHYDDDNLIAYDFSILHEEGEVPKKAYYHVIISKQDGSVTQPLPIPFERVNSTMIRKGDMVIVGYPSSLTPHPEGWLLIETSSDTIYQVRQGEKALRPYFVKTPPSTDPEIMITLGTITPRYCFIETTKKDFNVSSRRGFPSKSFVYDAEEYAFYVPKVQNGDFLKKQYVDLWNRPLNRKEVWAYQTISADVLTEAYEEEKLQGKLKEIASGLKEDDNPVLMLMKEK